MNSETLPPMPAQGHKSKRKLTALSLSEMYAMVDADSLEPFYGEVVESPANDWPIDGVRADSVPDHVAQMNAWEHEE